MIGFQLPGNPRRQERSVPVNETKKSKASGTYWESITRPLNRGSSRSLSMRHARKPIIVNVATSRERSDRVVDGRADPVTAFPAGCCR